MKQLKKLRTIVGRGQFWLADHTGIERSRISLLENGRVKATDEEKTAIEKALLAAMRDNVAVFQRAIGNRILPFQILEGCHDSVCDTLGQPRAPEV